MRIFYDTEFMEDGRTITPISIGMVREDGAELYRVNDAIDCGEAYRNIRRNRWLMRNVVAHLPLRPGSLRMPEDSQPGRFELDVADLAVQPLDKIAAEVARFVLEKPEPELWAWYAAYDHVLLAQLFGRMIDLPVGFPMHTNDLKQLVDHEARLVPRIADLPTLASDGRRGEHHALHDAREACFRYWWVYKQLGVKVPDDIAARYGLR